MISFGGSIDFDTFVNIISDRLGNNKTREGAFKLFQIYDPEDTGFLFQDILDSLILQTLNVWQRNWAKLLMMMNCMK